MASLRSQVSPGSVPTASESFNRTRVDNPAYTQIRAQLHSGNSEINSLLSKRTELQQKIGVYERRLEGSPRVEREYRLLARDYENAVIKYKEVKAKLLSAEMAESLESEQKGERFTLIEPPLIAVNPIKPNRPLVFLLGMIISLGAAFGLVMLLEGMDKSISNRHSLAAITGMQPIAVIPFILSKTEAEEEKRRKLVRRAIYLGISGIIIGVLVLVHLYVMPLDVLWFRGLRKLELMMF